MARKSNYSRLSKRLENQSKRNIILSLAGIVVIVFLMVRFGIPFLAGFTGFVSGLGDQDDGKATNDSSFISAPILDPITEATNSAELKVSGQITSELEVAVYLNDALLDKKMSEDNGSFSFKLYLHQGENKIKLQAVEGDKKSEFSDEEIVLYLNKEPLLEIKSPNDGQKFEKEDNRATISGTTDQGARVTINDFQAAMEGNNFSYSLSLQSGENNIKIVATDIAGNRTEKTLKVTYSQ